jgi:hypothetical protein
VDNCTILLPGYFAAAMSGGVVTSTIACPQKYYWCVFPHVARRAVA